MENLIVKYLLNDLSLEERHQLNKWLDENEVNAKILEKFELYWSLRQNNYDSERHDVLSRIQSEIAQLDPKERSAATPINSGIKTPSIKTYLKYAAAILVVIATGLLVFDGVKKQELQQEEITYVERVSLPSQKITTFLPDGTKVKLNSGSKIIVPSHFAHNKREVVLFGQAFFDVVRDEKRPFIVKTANLEVEVLGTSFDVKVYADDEKQHVAVRSGKVRVLNSNSGQEVNLVKNEMVEAHGSKTFTKLEEIDSELVFGWIEQKLVFQDNSLEEVLKSIEKWYGVEISSVGRLDSNKLYTARFDNPSLKQLMGSISHVYQFDYEIEQNNILITQK